MPCEYGDREMISNLHYPIQYIGLYLNLDASRSLQKDSCTRYSERVCKRQAPFDELGSGVWCLTVRYRISRWRLALASGSG